LTGLQFTYQAEGRSSEALSTLEAFMNKKQSGIPQEELLMKKGDILFGQGDFSGAINEYQHVLNMNPGRSVQANAMRQLARSYELQNNIERSNSYYRKILDEFSDSETAPAAALALGNGLIKLKQYSEAVNTLKDFTSRYSDSPLKTEAGYQLGLAMMNVPDPESALQQFQTVIQASPEHLFADKSRLQIARIYLQQKKYSSSMDTLNALIERRNDDLAAEGLNMIAENYRGLKRYKDALQAYNDVIQQYKEYPVQVERARFGTGETYEQLRDRKQARAAYNEIIKAPVDPEVRKEAEQRLKKLRK
jgi:tetratricopeptide (TPR) repeat protein